MRKIVIFMIVASLIFSNIVIVPAEKLNGNATNDAVSILETVYTPIEVSFSKENVDIGLSVKDIQNDTEKLCIESFIWT